MFQPPVLNSAAKVALIRLFASWQHLSALKDGCQTALEHFQSSWSQQMELQTICGHTTGPPVVVYAAVILSHFLYYIFFPPPSVSNVFLPRPHPPPCPITFGINAVLKAIKSQEKKTQPCCWSKSADLFVFPASNPCLQQWQSNKRNDVWLSIPNTNSHNSLIGHTQQQRNIYLFYYFSVFYL